MNDRYRGDQLTLLEDGLDLRGPSVQGELPGPLSAALLARQSHRESNARVYGRHFPIAVQDARGSFLRDVDGNVFIDFLTGAGVLSLGHCHPELVAVAAEQLGPFGHGLDLPTPAKDAFIEAQLSMLPAGCARAHTDALLRADRAPTPSTPRSSSARPPPAAATWSPSRAASTAPPTPRMALSGSSPEGAASATACPACTSSRSATARIARSELDPRQLRRQLRGRSWSGRCATPTAGCPCRPRCILEMVQGEGGVVPADVEFVRRVREVTRELGVPLVVDEVQTGCGRTGTWFAFEQYGIEPDVIVASKALSGIGQPVALIMYDERLDTWRPGAHTGTFRGNQLAFAAGARAVEIVRRDDVLGNVRARAAQIQQRLNVLRAHPWVRDVRGQGLMWGVELARSRDRLPRGRGRRASAGPRAARRPARGARRSRRLRGADAAAAERQRGRRGHRMRDPDRRDRPGHRRCGPSAVGSGRAMTSVLRRPGAAGAEHLTTAAPERHPTRDLVLVDKTRSQHLRWRPGDRLEQVFEAQCDRAPDRLCVDVAGRVLTYREVDRRANQLARHLLLRGIGPGHRVALLFDDPVQAYVAMLGVLKAGAAYVPLDPGFPADRLGYIVADSAATAVLSLAHLRPHLVAVRALVIAVDEIAARIAAGRRDRVTDLDRGPVVDDDVAYVIYTSGSTGRPKGVAVAHPSIVTSCAWPPSSTATAATTGSTRV